MIFGLKRGAYSSGVLVCFAMVTAFARELSLKYEMLYKIEFTGSARGHHISIDSWAPIIGEQLHCKPDLRGEARSCDKYAVSVCKLVDDKMFRYGMRPCSFYLIF